MAINDYCTRLWRVYKITFKRDGYAYVGMTCQPIPDRIQAHIRTPVNAELTNRLRNALDYDYEILHTLSVKGTDGEGIKQVYALERQEIYKLEKPINIHGINPEAQLNAKWWGHEQTTYNSKRRERKRNRCVHPPREGIYTCSICREKKPHTEFGADKTLFNGLDSRCKPCRRFTDRTKKTSKEAREYLRNGGVIETGYLKQRDIFSKLPEETKRAMIKDYEAGMSFQALAKKYDIHWNTIYFNFKRMGIKTRSCLEAQQLRRLREGKAERESNSKKRWTAAEDEQLLDLVTEGKSNAEIATILKRSENSVRYRKKHTLGIHERKHWTDAEDARLKQLLTTTDKSLSEIAKLMNRTESSIERRKERLGIRRVPFKLDRFNPLHVAELIKFKMAGWTHEQIAEVWGLKNSAQISAVLRSHGYHRFRACVGEKNQQRWGEVETHLLREYLKKGMSLKDIYKEFPHRSPSSIASKARKIRKYWLSPEEQAERQRLREKHKKWRVY